MQSRTLLSTLNGYKVVYHSDRKFNKYVITDHGKVAESYADWNSCMAYIAEHTADFEHIGDTVHEDPYKGMMIYQYDGTATGTESSMHHALVRYRGEWMCLGKEKRNEFYNKATEKDIPVVIDGVSFMSAKM